MSFDVSFLPCRYDGTNELRKSPYTAKLESFPRNEPLSEAEVDAVLGVLARAGVTAPDDHGVSSLLLSDGTNAEIFLGDVGNGCTFAIRGAGITPRLAQLLFDVMTAGNWVMLGGDEDVAFAPSHDCVRGAPSELGRIVVPASAEEIAAFFVKGFDAWKRYRDSAVGR